MHVVSLDRLGGASRGPGRARAWRASVADQRATRRCWHSPDRFADPGWRPVRPTAFSSAQKVEQCASFDGHGRWLIGAPEMLLAGGLDQSGVLNTRGGSLPTGTGCCCWRFAVRGRRRRRAGPAEPVALVSASQTDQGRRRVRARLLRQPERLVRVDLWRSSSSSARSRQARPARSRPASRPRELPNDDAPGAAARLARDVGESTVPSGGPRRIKSKRCHRPATSPGASSP